MSDKDYREDSVTPELPSDDSSSSSEGETKVEEKHKISKKIMRFICTCRQQTRIRKTPFGELIMSCSCGMIRRTSQTKYTDSSSEEEEEEDKTTTNTSNSEKKE